MEKISSNMKFSMLCRIHDTGFQKDFLELEDAKSNILENGYDWAVVANIETGNVILQYQQKTFLQFGRNK